MPFVKIDNSHEYAAGANCYVERLHAMPVAFGVEVLLTGKRHAVKARLSLTPESARELAKMLLECADAADDHNARYVPTKTACP